MLHIPAHAEHFGRLDYGLDAFLDVRIVALGGVEHGGDGDDVVRQVGRGDRTHGKARAMHRIEYQGANLHLMLLQTAHFKRVFMADRLIIVDTAAAIDERADGAEQRVGQHDHHRADDGDHQVS